MEQKWYQNVTGSTLKLIAIVCMLIDHIGATAVYRVIWDGLYLPQDYGKWAFAYQVMRGIGRTAFPIFCFLLVEGFFHTRNRLRYTLQLFLFAILSELPFDYAFNGEITWETQNVYFTLGIGLLVIWAAQKLRTYAERHSGMRMAVFLMQVLVLLGGCLLALTWSTDYDYKGILLIYIFYLFHHSRKMAGIFGYLSFLWEPLCFPAFLLIQCYNGQRGIRLKYVFYLFYPVHLMLLYIFLRVVGWA